MLRVNQERGDMPTSEKWEEIKRYAEECGRRPSIKALADLLAEIGVIHPTPDAKAQLGGRNRDLPYVR